MNIGALFKHALWIAPVATLIYFTLIHNQAEQKAKVEEKSSTMQSNFAQMNKEFAETPEEKAYWDKQQKRAEEKMDRAEKEAKAEAQKNKEIASSIDKEMEGLSESDLKQLENMAKGQ